jgi:hypothetical protein
VTLEQDQAFREMVALTEELGLYRDPCPACNEADLEPAGGKHRCPACGYIQPCCNP